MKKFTKYTIYYLFAYLSWYALNIPNTTINIICYCLIMIPIYWKLLDFLDWNFKEQNEQFTLARFRINNQLYEKSEDEIQEGDMVYDTRNNTYGICDMIKEDWIAIRDGHVVEVGVPKSRCFRLVLVSDEENY